MIISFTGHRPNRIGDWDPLHPDVFRVKTAIRDFLIKHWPTHIVSGMALGVDQWAAQIAVDLGIPFVAAMPCDAAETAWPLPSQERFRALVAQAKQQVIVSPGPYKPWKMDRRNEYLVDNCDLLGAVFDGSPGGTYNCLAYAAQVGREVERLTW